MNTADRFTDVRQLFDKVADLPPSEQHHALHAHTNDPQVIAEVQALLSAQTVFLQRVQRPLHAALQAADGMLEPGTQLGPWRIGACIGSGGMGWVYRAERADGNFELTVAIKVLRGFVDDAAQQRLARERQILADLAHPDIARLLDGGSTEAGQPYLVMEYVEGEPIDRHCLENGLDLNARIALFERVCAAVAHAHRQLIVHCDIKPSNVLVRNNGAPVLIDFGIASVLASGRDDTDGGALSTPRYASPEQLAGQRISTLSDVFSLGLLLYELLLGARVPGGADSQTQASALHPSTAANTPALKRRLRGDLDAIVAHATMAVPAQRYPSVAALAKDLQRHKQHMPVRARAGGLLYRAARWGRRHWQLAAVLAVLVTLATGFSFTLKQERDRAVHAERVAKVEANTAQQVSDFLISVFEFANPAVHPNHDITAREILDQGAQQINASLADQPRVKARLLYVLGRAYQMIGRSDKAVGLYDQSATQYLAAGVNAPLDAADSLSQQAVLESNLGHLDAAAATVAKVVGLRHGRVAKDSLAMADSLNTRGLIEANQSRYAVAEHDFLRALAIRRTKLGDQSHSVAVTLQNLGLLYHQWGREKQAQDYYRKALKLKRARFGPDHPETLITLINYARSLSVSGDWQQAIPMLRRAVKAGVHIYGAENSRLALLYNELGSAVHDRGHFREAADNYRHAMAIYTKLGLEHSSDFAPPLNNLASAMEDMGDIKAAIPLYRQSLALRRKVFDSNSASVTHGEYKLGRALMKGGHMVEAGKLLGSALKVRRATVGENSSATLWSELMHAEWLRRKGHLAQAASAFAATEHSPVKLNSHMLATRARGLGLIALAQGDVATAQTQLKLAWSTLAQVWGASHPLTAEAALDYVRALRAAGQTRQADKLLKQVAPVVRSAFVAHSAQRRLLNKLAAH